MTDVFNKQPLHAGRQSVPKCTPHALDSMQRVKTQNLVLLEQLFGGLEALSQELKQLLQHHTGINVEGDLAPAISTGPTQKELHDLKQALAEAIKRKEDLKMKRAEKTKAKVHPQKSAPPPDTVVDLTRSKEIIHLIKESVGLGHMALHHRIADGNA